MNQLGPSPTTYPPEDLLTRFSRGVTAWVLGPGMLTLHATVFAVAMTAMTLWNIYDAPSDLWVGDVLRRWGVVVCFHAILLAAGWIAWRLLKAEQAAIEGTAPSVAAPAAVAEPVTRAPLAARLGLAGGEAGTVAARADDLARRAIGTSAAWGTVAAHQTRRAVAVVTERWTTFRAGTTPPPAADGQQIDPARTWPEGFAAVRHEQTIVVASESTAGHAAPGQGSDVVLDVHGFAAVNGHAPSEAGAVPAAASPPPNGFTKDARWTWVETAAAAWLARREVDPPPPTEPANGHQPVPAAPTGPEPRATDTPPPPGS